MSVPENNILNKNPGSISLQRLSKHKVTSHHQNIVFWKRNHNEKASEAVSAVGTSFAVSRLCVILVAFIGSSFHLGNVHGSYSLSYARPLCCSVKPYNSETNLCWKSAAWHSNWRWAATHRRAASRLRRLPSLSCPFLQQTKDSNGSFKTSVT